LEKLKSENVTFFDLPEICFFKPSISLEFDGENIHSTIELPSDFWKEIEKTELPKLANTTCAVIPQISKEKYLENVKTIQNHIIEGNTYESNFCQAYSGTFENWDPISTYFKLNELS